MRTMIKHVLLMEDGTGEHGVGHLVNGGDHWEWKPFGSVNSWPVETIRAVASECDKWNAKTKEEGDILRRHEGIRAEVERFASKGIMRMDSDVVNAFVAKLRTLL